MPFRETGYGEHDKQKSLSWRQWKTDASGSDQTDKVGMEASMISCFKLIFSKILPRVDIMEEKKKTGICLLQKMIITPWLG